MKRFLIFIALITLSTFAIAQNTKKVAILETIDTNGDISMGVKLMVQSNLKKSISNAPGYEGYDRVNMSQIIGEQEFQRTGLVNEEQIKRLGEVAGCDYIIVSKVAKVDETSIFVTAEILNVETAQTIRADNALMTTTGADIQHGCESLANRLLGMEAPTKAKTTTESKDTWMSKVKDKLTKDKSEDVVVTRDTNGRLGELISFPDGSRGIIFYYENGRGLAVSLIERELKWDCSRKREDIVTLENVEQSYHPFIYGEGAKNTQAIIQQLGSNADAANWCKRSGEGWYLPSSGELYYLVTMAKKGSVLYNNLEYYGAKLRGWYWTSSEHNRTEAINISDGGSVDTENKDEETKVRAIRAFSE